MKPFIPSWLDESKLTAAEMRVFIHLLRSADNASGIAWPSYARMIEITGLSKSTIRRAINELKRRDLISIIGKPFAGSCRYTVLPIVPPEGQKQPLNSSTREPIESPPIVPPVTHNSPSSEPPIVPPEGQEGNPIKVIQLRKNPLELEFTKELPFASKAFHSAWGDWEQHRKEIKKPLTPTSTKQQLRNFAEMGEARAIAAIYHTIGNGWQGIREPEQQRVTIAANLPPAGTIVTGGRAYKA